MARQHTLEYVSSSWAKAVSRAATDANRYGWRVVDLRWEEPQENCLGVLFVLFEEPQLN